MKINELIFEGGWASAKTQGTTITPQTIASAIAVLDRFQGSINAYLETKGLPPIRIGSPVGSGTYYERDLKTNPTKEYGDIDVQFIIPRIEGETPNSIRQSYFDAVIEFCQANEAFETDNGRNVIFKVAEGWIQVDLVAIFDDRVEISQIMAPEHGTKGVLSASLYSALAEALNLSIGDDGVRAKVIDGKPVSFRKSKGTELVQVSTNPAEWAADIARFFGVDDRNFDQTLSQYKGKQGEVKIAHIVKSINGIIATLEKNGQLPEQYSNGDELRQAIKAIYIKKINAVINSRKFLKAATPAAKKKAEHTKHLLATRSAEIAKLL